MTILGLMTGIACADSSAPTQLRRVDGLIVLAGAIDVRDTGENQGTVLYELEESYPAEGTIQAIGRQLENSGWRPRMKDFLNGRPTGHVRGWTSYENSTSGRLVQIYSWIGQWEDASGRLAWYTFNYQGENGPGGTVQPAGRLKVAASVLSPDTVRALQEVAKTGGARQ